jgi:hypothetical protein
MGLERLRMVYCSDVVKAASRSQRVLRVEDILSLRKPRGIKDVWFTSFWIVGTLVILVGILLLLLLISLCQDLVLSMHCGLLLVVNLLLSRSLSLVRLENRPTFILSERY